MYVIEYQFMEVWWSIITNRLSIIEGERPSSSYCRAFLFTKAHGEKRYDKLNTTVLIMSLLKFHGGIISIDFNTHQLL